MEVGGDFCYIISYYFSDVLTMIMTSWSAIFLLISASLSVYVKYIPLISRVFGPYCKLRTEFSIDLWPKREVRGP